MPPFICYSESTLEPCVQFLSSGNHLAHSIPHREAGKPQGRGLSQTSSDCDNKIAWSSQPQGIGWCLTYEKLLAKGLRPTQLLLASGGKHLSGPEHLPPPPPPEMSRAMLGRKVVSTIIALIVVAVVLYVVFVPRFIEHEEIREARYEIVSEGLEIEDNWECVDWGFIWCNKYGWVRHIEGYTVLRGIEMDGDYVVSFQLTGGYNSSDLHSSPESPITTYIQEGQVRELSFHFSSFTIPEEGYQSGGYDYEMSVSAPKTVEKKQLTIFEWLAEGL